MPDNVLFTELMHAHARSRNLLGVIGGSGFYTFFDGGARSVEVETPYGPPSAPITAMPPSPSQRSMSLAVASLIRPPAPRRSGVAPRTPMRR